MRKFIPLLFFIATNIFADGFYEIQYFENKSFSEGGIPYSIGFAGGKSSPCNFFLSLFEDHIFIGDTHNDAVYNFDNSDLFNSEMIIIDPYENRSLNRAVLSDWVVPIDESSFLSAGLIIFQNFDLVIKPSPTNKKYSFPIGETVFYYDSINGGINAIDTSGNYYSSQEAFELLNSLHSSSDYSHIDQIEDRIIIDECYYTYRLRDLFEYFINTFGIDNFEGNNNPDSDQYLGYDYNGNSYWLNMENINELFIMVYSKYGELVNRTNYSEYFDFNGINSFYLSPKTGNVFYMVSNFEGTHIYKLNRTWGDPNMVTLAINGLDGTDYDDYVYEVLDRFSSEELRLQRNMVFALKDYRFSSQDLLEYYGQFNWYSPEKTIEEASAELTENQIRFVNYIRELEAGRE